MCILTVEICKFEALSDYQVWVFCILLVCYLVYSSPLHSCSCWSSDVLKSNAVSTALDSHASVHQEQRFKPVKLLSSSPRLKQAFKPFALLECQKWSLKPIAELNTHSNPCSVEPNRFEPLQWDCPQVKFLIT